MPNKSQGNIPLRVVELAISALLIFIVSAAVNATTVTQSGSNWTIQNQNLKITVATSNGYISVYDSAANYTWTQPGAISHRAFTGTAAVANGISFTTTFADATAGNISANLQVILPDNAREMQITATVSNLNTAIGGFDFIEPFTLTTSTGNLVAPDYCDGHIYPANIASWPIWSLDSFGASELDMPWIGVCDTSSGLGYSVIAVTPFDALFQCTKFSGYRAPQVHWTPQLGTYGYIRQINYEFTPNGGYVALAKAYRAYIQAQGGLVTLDAKAQTNPNITKLFGAPLMWDYFDYMSAQAAKAAGVDKMLHHVSDWGNPDDPYGDPAQLAVNNSLGYLTEEYDSYVDAAPITSSNPLGSYYDTYPANFAKNADGSTEIGFDGDYGQMYHRAPACYLAAAQAVIPGRLAAWPTTSRYMDVHTASISGSLCGGSGQDYDPNHTANSTQWENDAFDLFGYIRGQGQGMVLSGEHGKWWAVPNMDMMDGVMSSPGWPWSNKPTAYQQGTPSAWTTYETYGSIGNTYRVPLWELVYHDCSVAMWYPSDSSDYTVDVPGDWYETKKDCMNVLYGTPATFSNVAADGSWWLNRTAFMTSYRDTCKLHEVLADKEMLSHQFVTSDRNVQKTTWSDGTVVYVNFGTTPYTVTDWTPNYVLHQYDFVANGPSILAERSWVAASNANYTSIIKDGYVFSDSSGAPVTIRRYSSNDIHVNIDSASGTVSVYPLNFVPTWKFQTASVWECDSAGNHTSRISWTRSGGAMSVGPFASGVNLDFLSGATKNDFDGDNKTDFAAYTPGNAIVWSVLTDSSGFSSGLSANWGSSQSGDIPVSGDFDGDGKCDWIVYRPGSPGEFLLQTQSGVQATVKMPAGSANGIPVVGDFDGDGLLDVGVRSAANFTVMLSSTNYATADTTTLGVATDIPVCDDFDGDHKTDFAVYHPATTSTGTARWYVIPSSTGVKVAYNLGKMGDIPLTGDWDGDGKADLCVCTPGSPIAWTVATSSSGYVTTTVTSWGDTAYGDIPLSGDFDGDGITDYAVYRPGNPGQLLIKYSSGGTGTFSVDLSGGVPLTSFADITAPVISSVSVSPTMVAANDQVQIAVSASDNMAVSEVTANGVGLAWNGGTSWSGNLTAQSSVGTYPVTVTAIDFACNSSQNTTGSYRVVQIIGASLKSTTDQAMAQASGNYLIKIWGVATTLDSNTFDLNDGSGTTVEVVAPNHGVNTGDFVAVRGILSPGSTPVVLTTSSTCVFDLTR